MILKKREKSKIEIDLTGPDGNAFVIIGIAGRIGRQLGKTQNEIDTIRDQMMKGDYEHLLDVMEEHYGDYIIMYR